MGLGDLAGDIGAGMAGKAGGFLKRWRLFVFAGIAILVAVPLITLLVMKIAASASAKEKTPAPLFENISIPQEDLFLPDEPDFLPGVLLEQERKKTWSIEDAKQYWTDPVAGADSSRLREQFSASIDAMLERVP
jgi:hypothetical protein